MPTLPPRYLRTDAFEEISGKTVSELVMVEWRDEQRPATQLFIVLADGTSMEFWSSAEIRAAGSLDGGGREAIMASMAKRRDV
jgi:hypothetical protein